MFIYGCEDMNKKLAGMKEEALLHADTVDHPEAVTVKVVQANDDED